MAGIQYQASELCPSYDLDDCAFALNVLAFIENNYDDETICVVIRRLVHDQNKQVRYAITSYGNIYYAHCKIRTIQDPIQFDVAELIAFNCKLPLDFPFQLPDTPVHAMHHSIPTIESIIQANIVAISAIQPHVSLIHEYSISKPPEYEPDDGVCTLTIRESTVAAREALL
jgi:hypothetical protein